ncbi:MAG: outer membrane protein assembly factor BamB family protein, partial [Thermoguttaceae bacterium]
AHVLCKAAPGAGTSSTIVAGDRLYLTAFDGSSRFVQCLDAVTGKPLWKQAVARLRDETATPPGNPATCTPATDGRHLVAFFPDSGLFCFSVDGKQQWHVDLGPLHSMHGISASPVLVEGLVVLCIDQLRGSHISAYRLDSGQLAWTVPRLDGLTGAYSTPSVLPDRQGPWIVANGPHELCVYRASTGDKGWSVPGFSNAPISLPLVAGGRIFTCEQVGTATPFSMLASMDKDHDGKYSLDEAKGSLPMHRLLERIDNDHGNRDGLVEPSEWDAAFGGFLNRGGLAALALAPVADARPPRILWTYRKSVPHIASPLLLGGVLYVVQDGGIVTSFDPETGDVLRRGRLDQGGKQFYASPVAADGRIVLLDTQGRLTLLKAARQWSELSSTELGEPSYATPAISGGRLYVRTAATLYCLGRRP